MRDLPHIDIPKGMIAEQYDLEPCKRAVLSAMIEYYPAAVPREILQEIYPVATQLADNVSKINLKIRKYGFYIKSLQIRGFHLKHFEETT